MASSNPSWPLLPFDLVENILYKVPVESLVRFKSTCKQWYALLNDKRFIYKHLELSREGLIQVHDHNSCQFINLETLALSSLQGLSDLHSMIHCDGLLLCQYIYRPLAVWNPFLSQIKWIEPWSSYTRVDKYGFGYDNVSRDNYKILKYCQMPGHEKVEIYEFKTQLWRSVDYSCAYSWYVCDNQAVSMNGNMYWLAQTYNDYSIQCFDFSREVFKVICCDTFINGIGWLLPSLSSFGGDRLSLSAQDTGKIHVWVTNSVTDEVVSWSKCFNVTLSVPDLSIFSGRYIIGFPMYFIHKSNRFMLWCEVRNDQNETYVNVYEIGEGVVKKQVERGRHRWCDHCHLFSCVFVPSLVPVPE